MSAKQQSPGSSLALLAPLMTVIVLFHFALNPGGIPLALVLVVTGGMLAIQYRNQFAHVLRPAPGRDA